jgi:hypothetical protein
MDSKQVAPLLKSYRTYLDALHADPLSKDTEHAEANYKKERERTLGQIRRQAEDVIDGALRQVLLSHESARP